jgi:hypothetical protein
MPWRHMEERRYSFIILGMDTRWRLTVSFTPRQFYPRGKSPRTHWTGGWVDCIVGLDAVEWRQILDPVGNRTPAVRPVARYYADCTIRNLLNTNWKYNRRAGISIRDNPIWWCVRNNSGHRTSATATLANPFWYAALLPPRSCCYAYWRRGGVQCNQVRGQAADWTRNCPAKSFLTRAQSISNLTNWPSRTACGSRFVCAWPMTVMC